METNFEENAFFSNINFEDSFIYFNTFIHLNENEELKNFVSRKKLYEDKKNVLEKLSKELKKEKNKISAKKSRKKKNLDIQNLIKEKRRLSEENIKLKKQLHEIKEKIPFLCNNCHNLFENVFSSNNKEIFIIYKEN